MIGIINNALDSFSILEKVRNKYPKINIYIYQKSFKLIDEAINKLIEKNCKIIILPKEYKKIKSQKNISFVTLEDNSKKDCFVLEDEELLKSIEEGNQKEIEKRIKKLKEIPYQKIQINNPKLLYIKSMIEEITNCEVIDNIDNLLEEIDNIIKTKKYNVIEDEIVNVIV